VIAYAMLGEGEQALELLQMLNPIKRTASRAGVYAYKVEPYVLAADIYAEPPHVRRGGWTWYTGAAGWFYCAGIESILGLQVRSDSLEFTPCIASHWPSYQISYQYQTSRYQISVENPKHVNAGIVSMELDGVSQENCRRISLIDDGKLHQVRIELG
jgi:cyclic beta-1,2-glucan synthetase